MKYVYAALLLHASGKNIDEDSLTKVIASTGEVVDEARVKALVASLSEVDIEEAIKTSPGLIAAPSQEVQKPVKKETKEEEEKEEEEEAIAGLGALFG